MKVKELIEHLSKLDQDLEVKAIAEEGGEDFVYDIGEPDYIAVTHSEYDEDEWCFWGDQESERAEKAVRIWWL